MAFSMETDFHDAILLKIEVDYERKEASIYLDAYENLDANERSPVAIRYSGLRKFSAHSDAQILDHNKFAGQVAFHSAGDSSSFLHLIDGMIAIEAERMHVDVLEK